MSQKKRHSFLEACINILIGFSINFVANLLILPAFGFDVHPMTAFNIGLVFTVISIIRSYYIRRMFNYFHTKGIL